MAAVAAVSEALLAVVIIVAIVQESWSLEVTTTPLLTKSKEVLHY